MSAATTRTPTRADYSLSSLGAGSSSTLSSSSSGSPPVRSRRRSSTPTASPAPSPLRSPPPPPSATSSSSSSPSRVRHSPASTMASIPSSTAPPPPVAAPLDHLSSDTTSSLGLRKELDQRLSAYLPAVVRRHLESRDAPRVPDTHETNVVSMFADVSGFTAMTESLAARGPVGAEFLGRHLNSYFEQLLRLVSSAGGDVFKFAGDAMLIFWPENKDDTLETLLRRCVQCALRIQSHLHKAELAPGVVLSVKMGIGMGGATIAHLGGVSDGAIARMEYIAVGPALEQAFASEHEAEPGQVICSPQCWQLIAKYFTGEPVRVGSVFQKVTAVVAPIKVVSRRASFMRDDAQLHLRMKQYVSRAVWPYLDAHDEFWGSELRDLTVLFINVGFREDDLAKMLDVRGLQRLQDAFRMVQKCIYEYEGTINKFLVDDKGSTVIAAFGLPPVTHENDPIRGILASLAICAALGTLGLKASVGITTGVALCGVVGHQGNRREYTVLGDIVNLSARLMQKAKSENGGVITDEATKLYTHDVLHFEERPEIFVKGKNDSIKIHRPYPRMSILLEYHLSSTRGGAGVQHHRKNAVCDALPTSPRAIAQGGMGGREEGAIRTTPIQNVMDNMHRVQVRDAQRRLSLRAEKQAANAPSVIESESFVAIRETLVQACSRLNRLANGGSFILEGDIGVGKTVLLRTALLASPEAGGCNVCIGTASPFATRKPYAVWAEIITKSALESFGDQGSSSSIMTPETAMRNLQLNDFSKDAERRRRVANFVRRKIREGAAPNTTLARYAHLLNGILDTTFEAHIDEDCAVLYEGKAASGFVRVDDNNNHEDDGTHVMSPSKMHVKEEDLAAWFLGLLEMDLLASRRDSEDSVASASDPRKSSASVLDAKSAPDDPETRKSSSRSEHKLQQQRERDWKPTELDLSGILLLCALYAMSRDRATVFCLDNAMFMDDKSWVLATIIAKYFTNCMVVIGTRPPSLSLAEHTQSSSFRKRLRVLKKLRPSVSLTMEPLGATQIHSLAREILKVQVIPNELVSILISRSQGNPLFLHEIIGEMLQQQVIKVDETRYRCFLQVQEAWGDKSGAHFCFYCYFKFVQSKEKHRCKSCGYVFCAPCTPTECRKKLLGSTGEPVRHCRNCYTLSSTRRPSSDRSLAAAASAIAAGTFSSSGTAGTTAFGLLKGSKHKRSMRSLFHPELPSKQPPPSSATHTAASLKTRIAVRPPKTVKSVLTTVLDQLSVSQRMLLKTASVIGSVFDEELLRGASPIKAHLGRFRQDLDDLERLAMIRRLDTFIAGLKPIVSSAGNESSSSSSSLRPPNVKIKYEFCHGFMQDVIRSQMLCSQLDKLSSRIADCREHQEKELRQRFFEKAKDSLSRPMQVSVPVHLSSSSLVPCRRLSNSVGQRQRRRSFTSIHEDGESRRDSTRDTTTTTANASVSRQTSSASCMDDSQLTYGTSSSSSLILAPSPQRVLKTVPTFLKLKTGTVFVKKQSSLFAHLHFKGLTNARLWKKRFAVLHNARLSLQYDDVAGAKPRQGTSLFLKGAKVSACDPEVAAKVNCFQVEVNEWTKGKYLMNSKRFFVMGVQSELEVENWVFMIRYAIESLENQSQ